MSVFLRGMGPILFCCFLVFFAFPAFADSLENLLPQSSPEEKQAPARKSLSAPKASRPSQQGAKRIDWAGTYSAANQADYEEGYVTVKPGGSAWQVELGFSFGRGLNRSMCTLDKATGKEENGNLYIYNRKNRHVFTLTPRGKSFRLIAARGLTERELFTRAETMSPGDDEPLIEPGELDGKDRGRWAELLRSLGRWDKSDF